MVRRELPQLIGSGSREVHTLLGELLGIALRAGGIGQWPTLLVRATAVLTACAFARAHALRARAAGQPSLMEHLLSRDLQRMVGALRALRVICEDCIDELESNEAGRPADQLVPLLIPLLRHDEAGVRALALACLHFFLAGGTPAMIAMMPTFLRNLFALASDQSPDVCKLVCEALTVLVETSLDLLASEMDGVVSFIFHATDAFAAHDEVPMAATKFWIAFAQRPECSDFVVPHLPRLLPLLLRNMVYSEMELAALDNGRSDDAAVPDDPRDLRPVHGRDHGDGGDDDDDDDEEDDWGETEPAWTLRIVSARALDHVAARAPEETLDLIFPLLNEVC